MIVYKLTNQITNEIYIGQTTQPLSKRLIQHKNAKKPYPISRAIQKYGIHNFKVCVVLRANNLVELNHREQLCIRLFNSMKPNGYNLTSGGLNCKMSTETKEKIRKLKTGLIASEETKRKMSDIKKGKPTYRSMPEEHKQRLRKINSERVVSEETRQKYRLRSAGTNNPMYGKRHNEETRRRISNSLSSNGLISPKKGKTGYFKHTAESKRKISEKLKGHTYNRGKKRTDEFKENCRKRVTLRNQKRVINKNTGEILDTAKMLPTLLNMPYSTIINMLNGTNPNKLDWEYLVIL